MVATVDRKPTMRTLVSIVMAISAAYSSFTIADDLSQKKFERQFYEPKILSRFTIDAEDFRALSAAKQNDLLEARAALIKFFANTRNLSEDPRRFLGEPLSDRFKNRTELYAAVFWLGTTPYVISVRDFKLLEQDLLDLSYYVVVMLEGTMVLREDRARLRRIGTTWKIVRIAGIE